MNQHCMNFPVKGLRPFNFKASNIAARAMVSRLISHSPAFNGASKEGCARVARPEFTRNYFVALEQFKSLIAHKPLQNLAEKR